MENHNGHLKIKKDHKEPYCVKLYANKLNDLEQKGKFLVKYNFISLKGIECFNMTQEIQNGGTLPGWLFIYKLIDVIQSVNIMKDSETYDHLKANQCVI